jgi:transposase
MNRAAWLQDRRMQKFRDVLGRWEAGELSMLEAGELLGMSERQFRRYRDRYEEEGQAGLVDRRLGKPSQKRVPDDARERMLALYREEYREWNVKHFHEQLRRDYGFRWGYTWTKTQLHTAGLVERTARCGPHRRKRPRKPCEGMMLHQDGSRFVWLAGQPMLDLIVTMDDATSKIYSAFLVEEEGTSSTFRGLAEVFAAEGLPSSLYTDRGSHYFFTPQAGEPVDKERLTQVGRALDWLGIEHIPAYSPEARGRSERMFGTLQDRLAKELARAGISEIAAANRFIREVYLPAHNSASRLRRPARARPSPRSPASISTRSCASRRNGRSATTIASPTARSNSRSRRARCARTSSRRGSRSTSMPTAPTRSSTGRAASAATMRTERSGMRNKPPKSARRRNPCGRHGQACGLPTPSTAEQNQKKRTYDVLPKPDKLIRYRQLLPRRLTARIPSRANWAAPVAPAPGGLAALSALGEKPEARSNSARWRPQAQRRPWSS